MHTISNRWQIPAVSNVSTLIGAITPEHIPLLHEVHPQAIKYNSVQPSSKS
jgi:hypothetical protein